jgi:hypothetical protein
MSGSNVKRQERYTKGTDVVNFIVYERTTGLGDDQVLQHKLLGTTEMAHITLHPDGTVNLRAERDATYLMNVVRTNMEGFLPQPSPELQKFLRTVRDKIEPQR